MEHKIKIYIYPYPLTKDDRLCDGPVSVGERCFALDNATMLIWVDLMPEARFAHPTAYVLISGRNTRVERGNWWPMLNGKRILLGEQNSICVPSPFDLAVAMPELSKVLGEKGAEQMAYTLAEKCRHVYTVDFVDIAIIKTNPPQLLINAVGAARTSGWLNPVLSPRIYVQPPLDGIWEFDFLADPPAGVALEVITPINASYMVDGGFQSWKGVRVVAETNAKEKLLGKPRKADEAGHFVIEGAKV